MICIYIIFQVVILFCDLNDFCRVI